MARPHIQTPHYTYAEYLQIEADTGIRHEFLAGQIFAMAGGTPNHAKLGAKICILLGQALKGRPCDLYSADLKVHIGEVSIYPDALVQCGELRLSPDDRNATLSATVIIEVLSPSTETYDRGEKFDFYKQIPELREYVLISSTRQKVEVYQRQPEGRWLLTDYGPGSQAVLPSLEASFSVDELYERVTLEASTRVPVARVDSQLS